MHEGIKLPVKLARLRRVRALVILVVAGLLLFTLFFRGLKVIGKALHEVAGIDIDHGILATAETTSSLGCKGDRKGLVQVGGLAFFQRNQRVSEISTLDVFLTVLAQLLGIAGVEVAVVGFYWAFLPVCLHDPGWTILGQREFARFPMQVSG